MNSNMFRTLDEDEAQDFIQWAQDFIQWAQDFIQWAVDNHKPGEEISEIWHPIIQAKCREIDAEHFRNE